MSRVPNRFLMLGIMSLFAVSWLSGCSLLPKEEEALKPPLVKPMEEQYNTVKVSRGTLTKEVRGTGTLESTRTEYAQFTQQGGRIKEIAVTSGDKVKKGDLLVQLDVEGLDLKLKEQELALERAKLAWKKAKSNSANDQDELRVAALQIEIEQIKYDRLLQTVTGKQLNAQMDGQVIYSAGLKTGDIVEAYQTLVILADPAQLRVSLQVDSSSSAGDVMVGMSAAIKLDDKMLTGKVVQTPSSAPVTLDKALAERNAKTLYLELPEVPAEAEIGSMAQVTILTQKKEDVLKIPRSALRQYLGRTFVQVLDGKVLRETDVETGLQASTEIEIAKGLEEGQDIVLN